jgi:SAM-dependent methyltransferase
VLGDRSGPFTFDGSYGQYKGRNGYCKPRPWHGVMVYSEGRPVARVENGVIDFTSGHTWSESRLARLREQDRIRRNWFNEWEHARSLPARTRICERALQTGGPILELAAGPGGGNLSPLLHMDPGVPLIVNDIEPALLHMWREFLEEQLGYTVHTVDTVSPNRVNEITSVSGPSSAKDTFTAIDPFNLCLVAFDACREWPVLDGAIACVSSMVGLSHLEGTADKVLFQLARVLKPGGILVGIEIQFTQDTIMRVPDELKQACRQGILSWPVPSLAGPPCWNAPGLIFARILY